MDTLLHNIDIVIAALLLYLVFKRRSPQSLDESLRALFELGSDYRVVGADIGKHPVPAYVNYKIITGKPDSLFHSSQRSHWVVGEVKARKHKGQVHDHELYQVTLYIGMVKRSRKGMVEGYIRYDDRLVAIPYNEQLFQSLVGIAPEALKAQNTWRPADRRPLKKRGQGLFSRLKSIF
jgi:CRISPR/Cas system-associated exonuclease Cas4 (RecB family)